MSEVSDILVRAGVHHFHLDPVADHACDVVELHVAAGDGVVQPRVTIFFDDGCGFTVAAFEISRTGFALNAAPQRNEVPERDRTYPYPQCLVL